MKTRTVLAACCLAIWIAGCDSSAVAPSLATDRVLAACSSSTAADTFDSATGVGCQARTTLQICEVPSGSVMHADGTITTPAGTTVACSPTCAATDFTMACHGTLETSIPTPAAGLGCTIIPVPTPSMVLLYCCPCSP